MGPADGEAGRGGRGTGAGAGGGGLATDALGPRARTCISSNRSPVPKKMMGDDVAATAERAATLGVAVELDHNGADVDGLLEAAAWSAIAWPAVPSMTNTVWSIVPFTSSISEESASCLCRPLVSTMMTSYPSFLNCATPSCASSTGSATVYEP